MSVLTDLSEKSLTASAPIGFQEQSLALNFDVLAASLKESAMASEAGHLEDRRFRDYTKTLQFGAERLHASTPVLSCISGIGSCYLSLLAGDELRQMFLEQGGRVSYMTLPGHNGDWDELRATDHRQWDDGVSEKLSASATYQTSSGKQMMAPQVVLTYSGSVPSVLKHELRHPGSLRAIIMVSPLLYLSPQYGIPLRAVDSEPVKSLSRLALKSMGADEISYSKVGYTEHDREFLDITLRSISVDTLFQFVPVARGGREALRELSQRENRPEIFCVLGGQDASLNPLRTKSFLESQGIQVQMFEKSNHRLHVGENGDRVWQEINDFARRILKAGL